MAKAKLDDMMGGSDNAPDIDTPVPGGRPSYATETKFGAEEISTPILKIAQGLSPEVRDGNARPGQFTVQGFEAEDAVTLIPVGFLYGQRYLKPGEQRASCWSQAPTKDALVGLGEFKGRPCADCELSKWTRDPDTDRNIVPPCGEVDDWLCYSVTHGMAVRYPMRGTAMKASRFIKQLVNAMDMGTFAVSVNSKSVSKNGRTWQEPEVTLSRDITADDARVYANIARGAAGPATALPEGSDS